MNYKNILKRHRLGVFIAAGVMGLSASLVYAEVAPEQPEPFPISSLKGVKPAEDPKLYKYVKNRDAAIKLGKAFFWDMQAGSQGQSCGSCHFHAGADNRTKNQLSPSLLHTDPYKAGKFDPTLSGGKGGPNYTLKLADFPFRKLSDPDDRNSYPIFDTNDVASSQGVFSSEYGDLFGGVYNGFQDKKERCKITKDIFHVNDIATRKVEPRNTPTMINAIFNFRNFWDGRANNEFNGVDPFGRRNKNAYVIYMDPKYGTISHEKVSLKHASAASQAVGPPTSFFEMTCEGKSMAEMGKKLLGLKPLGLQLVDSTDSELGELSSFPSKGLNMGYRQMIMEAFNEAYWKSGKRFDGYTQMQHNFSLFWGLAIQLYESTLVSDDSPFDRYMNGDKTAMTYDQIEGMKIFTGKGKCANCHDGPLFTKAAIHLVGEDQEGGLIERMFMGDGGVALYDNAFYNIGVRPTEEDVGVGGTDPWGNPLSFTRQAQDKAAGKDVPDSFEVDPSKFEVDPDKDVDPYERNAVDGAFKVSGLRNIELTGPYTHNGGMATLEQVVAFYNRGGDRTDKYYGSDSTGFGDNKSNLDPDIQELHLNEKEQAQLVAFLKALTDDRVRWEKAPFDRPQLLIPAGAAGDEYYVQDDGSGKAVEDWIDLPAVGKYGRGAKNLPPVQPFLYEEIKQAEAGTIYKPEAMDDTKSGSYKAPIYVDVVANDKAGTYEIDKASVVIVTPPNSRYGEVTTNGDGTISYKAYRIGEASFTYKVKDTEGYESNVATVNLNVTF